MADAIIEEIRSLLPQGMLWDWVRLGSRLVRLLRDRRHPEVHEPVLGRLLAQARASVALRERRRALVPSVTYPSALPIAARKDDIVAAIRGHQVVVIAGETGSGKTTQIPKMCLEAGLGIEARIGCTQPRRVAALSISRRLGEELNVTWGAEVGCKIRFDDHVRPETYVKVMTDGILLAETQGDPLLCEYNALIIDEAHERSLNIDFLLGYLKSLLVRRPELKLIITSATIDTEAFSRAFNDAPVIEVSGRLFPVEVVYEPLDSALEENGELTYIDAAVQATQQVLSIGGAGDVLIFLPTERDIREITDRLSGRFGNQSEIIPLFGRLSSADQQRVFLPCQRRKIVVATNIAETSLTIPGIRYVIDSGLARVSRYNPRTRTRRLPIEPISQSSADQRKGRSGRVQNGVCLRLYSEADFAARPRFTQPEIQRANLAEVILRMKAFRLGEIETFPFLNPPSPAAVQGGYKLLQELGALNENRELTPLGRDLARLPIDPTLGRMLLQATRERATGELLIIATGLSIQDPRERPLDQRDAAAAAHKRFADPQSDFLTLLNLWNAVHEQWETLPTQNQRRKFCKANFLSYVRMREWQDLHSQLQDALDELGSFNTHESKADYAAIHRSILAGLLGHVGERTKPNTYKAAGNREITLFPGSVLFSRSQQARSAKKPARPARSASSDPDQPGWIVAGEIVETSQLFARTVAGIDPLWIAELGAHVCRVTHHHPHWNPEAAQVLAEERTTLYGLEVRRRNVAYGNIDPAEATSIFIRSALVEEHLLPEPAEGEESPARKNVRRAPVATAHGFHEFLEHNRRVRQKVEIWQTRMRRHDGVNLDEALFHFYSARLRAVSSLHELHRFLREEPNRTALCAKESDLIGTQDVSFDAEAFPDAVRLAGQDLPLSYAYSPGEDHDGVTVTLSPDQVRTIPPATLEWAVPGLREAQISELLRALPKAIRRQLMPLSPKIAEILRDLQPSGQSLKQDLARFLQQRYGIQVSGSAWGSTTIPQHVRPRVQVLDGEERPIGAGRDLVELRTKLANVAVKPPTEPAVWTQLARTWERYGIAGWTFGDLPDKVTVSETGDRTLTAWPGLELEDGHLNVRLFRNPDVARTSSLPAVQRLVELELHKELGWLQKELRAVGRFENLYRGLFSQEELQTLAHDHLRRHVLPQDLIPALTEKHFREALDQARARLAGLGSTFIDLLEIILKLRQEILHRYVPMAKTPVPATRTLTGLQQLSLSSQTERKPNTVEKELGELVPQTFLELIPFAQLGHLPRYLKALLIRAERASLNPAKDQEKAQRLAPYLAALAKSRTGSLPSPTASQRLQEFRWMLEEFKVSLFAQELGTAFRISAQRLDEQLERIARSED